MKFWDSSAIVPLLVKEHHSATIDVLLQEDRSMVVWWGSMVECASALARRQRERTHSDATINDGFAALDALALTWEVVNPGTDVAIAARRLVRVHPLRAADALQLAAAGAVAGSSTIRPTMVCLDDQLRSAATKEGFSLLPASI